MAVIKIVPMPGAVGDKGDEGAPGAQGPQGPAGQNGLPGTPALWSYQGAYNPAAAYAVGDVVVYQGQLYYTKSVTTAGTLPTVTAKFDLIASKGADGTNGTNGTNGADGAPGAGFGIFYLGNYNPSSGYVPDIAVVRGSDGQLYLAKASGALGDPVGNTAQWEVWIPKGQDGAPGTNGADALWNYVGEYSGGAAYAVGDVVTYEGQLWYRYNANGGNVGDTPSPGLWNLLAAKGADGSGNADIADFVFTDDSANTGRSIISLPGDKGITIAAGEESDLYLTAGDDLYIQTLGAGDDIHLNAADDIRFTTGNENIEFATPPYWRMNSEGRFVLPGEGYITNPTNSSGDGSGLSTINLFPDGNITSDQYVIIDPTSPNHIHLRAGGVQDNSNAHIFLGGEKNNIEVSDPYRTVKISTKPDDTENIYANSNGTSNTEFVHASSADIQGGDTVRLYTGGPTYVVDNVTQEYPYAGAITVTAPGLSFITGEAYVFTRDQVYNNEWTFGNDGVLSGPAMGGIWVESIQKKSVESGLGIYSPVDIVLEASNGEFLNDSSNPNNQIATIGDIPDIADFQFLHAGTAPYSEVSSINITDHDMRIQTIKSSPEIVDADIRIQSADNIAITSVAHITMVGSTGEFLGNPEVPANQIATLGDLTTPTSGTWNVNLNTSTYTYEESSRSSKTFAEYYLVGDLVHFDMNYCFENQTNGGFGYLLFDLPFLAKNHSNNILFTGVRYETEDPLIATGQVVIWGRTRETHPATGASGAWVEINYENPSSGMSLTQGLQRLPINSIRFSGVYRKA